MSRTRAEDLAVPKTTTKAGPGTVIVVVEGGIVQWAEGGPPGLDIEVRDYDIDGVSDEELVEGCEQDEWGDCFSTNGFRTPAAPRVWTVDGHRRGYPGERQRLGYVDAANIHEARRRAREMFDGFYVIDWVGGLESRCGGFRLLGLRLCRRICPCRRCLGLRRGL